MAKLLTSKDLADILCVSSQYVNESRVSGFLMGYKAPKHLKMGRTVRYEESTVNEWINMVAEHNAGGDK